MLNTVIFDMDGLLIDSEPCWREAGSETLLQYDIRLTDEQHYATTGLRTPEWIEWWFRHFKVDGSFAPDAIGKIESLALEKICDKAMPMPGVEYIFDFFKERNFRIGLASSSSLALIETVADKLGIKDRLDAYSSAQSLRYGKPHPEVFLNCANQLGSSPLECLCFEDSFMGLVAAKASRMKCVVIPTPSLREDPRWIIADLQLAVLVDFTEAQLRLLS